MVFNFNTECIYFYLIGVSVAQFVITVMKNSVCDVEEHQRNMNQWDEAIQQVSKIVSSSTQDEHHEDIGVQFPAQSHACSNQYGALYAAKYGQVFEPLMQVVSDESQGSVDSDKSVGYTRWRKCRLCCQCCPGMIGCGVCCSF